MVEKCHSASEINFKTKISRDLILTSISSAFNIYCQIMAHARKKWNLYCQIMAQP